MKPILICREDNDLYLTLKKNGLECQRFHKLEKAVQIAPRHAGILLLADGYPDVPTPLDPTDLAFADANKIRIYMEFPASIPDMRAGSPRACQWERAVVNSDAFAPGLENLRILTAHGCRFVPVDADRPHIVLARVAGLDSAVYGLPKETFPVLFEHPGGRLLVATTKLSQFVTGRYGPTDAWQQVWRWILQWLLPRKEAPPLHWTTAARPSYEHSSPLPHDAEQTAVCRGLEWFRKAHVLIHPSWKAEAERRLMDYPNAAGPGPTSAWESGDGSLGVLEGAASWIHPDGSQDWRYRVRSDCTAEVSMSLALGAAVSGSASHRQLATNLNDFLFAHPRLAGGPRADAHSPSFGILAGATNDANGGLYAADDNARAILGAAISSAALGETRWDEAVSRCLLANLRVAGPQGFRGFLLDDDLLQKHSWQHCRTSDRTHYSPSDEGWLWACFLWASRFSEQAPFLKRAETAIRMTLDAYPNHWIWTGGMQPERARMLLPLAWLVRRSDTSEHRQWLRRLADDLLTLQDSSGAIREDIGSPGAGRHGPPASNDEYGTADAPLIQRDGDTICDLLRTAGFALIGLHEAASATGDEFYVRASNRLVEFLCRAQVTSETHPELDGAWFRTFDFIRWEYWGSNADLTSGAWCISAGGAHAWILSVMALRQMKTSLWDLTAGSHIGEHIRRWTPILLPDA